MHSWGVGRWLAGLLVCGLYASGFLNNSVASGVVFLQLITVEWVEIIFAKIGFGELGKVFLRSGHGVGLVFHNIVTIETLNLIISSGGLGLFVGCFDSLVFEAEDFIVIGMCEFVKQQVGHAPVLEWKDLGVGNLNCFAHDGGATIALEPFRIRMIFGASNRIAQAGK